MARLEMELVEHTSIELIKQALYARQRVIVTT
jgi:hypothetical protein